MGRRSQGGISRRADGRWVVTVQVEGQRVWRYARTEREAKALLADLRRDLVLGRFQPPTRMTLADWLLQDGAQRQAQGLRASTLATERQVLGRLEARLGRVRLHALTPAMVAQALADLRRAGMGSRRLELAHACLRSSLNRAVALGLLAQNPVERVPRPRHEPREKPTWTVAQARAFLGVALASRGRYGPAFALQLATGLRPSELLGLRWEDWDPTTGTLTVRRAVVWRKNSAYSVEAPKSRAGRRTIAVGAVGRQALALLRERAGTPGPEAPIVVAKTGAVPRPAALASALAELCRRAGVPQLSPHRLRAVHISVLTGAGMDPKAVQRRAGHQRLDVTLNTYAFAVQGDHEAAEALDRLLGAAAAAAADDGPRGTAPGMEG
jgi:integrase